MKLQWVPGVLIWSAKFVKDRAVDVGKLAAWAAVAAYKTAKGAKDLAFSASQVIYRKTKPGKRRAVRDAIDDQLNEMASSDKWIEIPENEEGEGGGRFFVHPTAFFQNLVPEKVRGIHLSSMQVAEAVHHQNTIFYLDELEHETAKTLAEHIGQIHLSESRTPEDYLALFLSRKPKQATMLIWHDFDYPNEPVEQVLAGEHESGVTAESSEKEWKEAHDLRVELLFNSFLLWGEYEDDGIPFWEMKNKNPSVR